MTIKVAIMGASFAKAAYLPAFKTIPDVEVVALASARARCASSVASAGVTACSLVEGMSILQEVTQRRVPAPLEPVGVVQQAADAGDEPGVSGADRGRELLVEQDFEAQRPVW